VVRNAYLTLSRTELPAPVSGFVARRNVQLGERVGPGSALMAVVPLDEVWVDANFKEPQMAHMRVGQPVTLTADLYGAHVLYHGKVAGFGAGTGAAFSLLPAQNATGNWIKVVQRVPVRIALQPEELRAHPLRVGLSTRVSVDVRNDSGPALAPSVPSAPALTTHAYDMDNGEIKARIAEIIRENSREGAAPAG
jgi:membrane fusion protein (multidrug efflux system)